MGGPATRGPRPDWCGENEWVARLDGPSRAADVRALLAARWAYIPGPHLPAGDLPEPSLRRWAAYMHWHRN